MSAFFHSGPVTTALRKSMRGVRTRSGFWERRVTVPCIKSYASGPCLLQIWEVTEGQRVSCVVTCKFYLQWSVTLWQRFEESSGGCLITRATYNTSPLAGEATTYSSVPNRYQLHFGIDSSHSVTFTGKRR
jgi:hypothetical protein